MTLNHTLSAVRIGEEALAEKHAAVQHLWWRFGQSVRKAREARGMTTKDFAKKLGVTAAMLAYMEKNERRWPMSRAELAVKVLARPEQWPDCGRG